MAPLDALLSVLFLIFSLVFPRTEFPSEPAYINGERFTLYYATTPEQWQKGFQGKTVGEREAMLFVFPDSRERRFWMMGTKSPLDIIFLDGDFRVTGIYRNLQPCRLSCATYPGEGMYVLELRGGVSEELGLKEGERVLLMTESVTAQPVGQPHPV